MLGRSIVVRTSNSIQSWSEGDGERERAVRNWQLQTFSFYQMEAIRSLVEWKSFEDFHLIRGVSVGHLLPLCSFDSMAQGAPKERAARRSSVWVPKSKQLGRTTKP